jgi:hypothetical protein
MPRRGSPYGPAYQRARAQLLARNPRCHYCPHPASTADHVPPLALHHHREGSGCCHLVPACPPCQVTGGRGGWSLANNIRAGRTSPPSPNA